MTPSTSPAVHDAQWFLERMTMPGKPRDDITHEELRAALTVLGWSSRQFSGIAQIGRTNGRNIWRGKDECLPWLAPWLHRLSYAASASAFPIGAFWVYPDLVGMFLNSSGRPGEKMPDGLPRVGQEEIDAMLRFVHLNRLPEYPDDWHFEDPVYFASNFDTVAGRLSEAQRFYKRVAYAGPGTLDEIVAEAQKLARLDEESLGAGGGWFVEGEGVANLVPRTRS